VSNTGLMLTPRIHPLEAENERLRREIESANYEISQSRELHNTQAVAVQNIRDILEPLFSGLKRVFGEMEHAGFETYSAASVDPRKAAIWSSWKQKMPGNPAKFIDALLLHGELTQTQLRLHAQCAQGSVAGVVSQLWKNGLINKNGGKISLKEL